MAVKDVCSRHGVSDQTSYRWRKSHGTMQVDEVRRLREREGENAWRKRLLAESVLEIDAIREVLRGK